MGGWVAIDQVFFLPTPSTPLDDLCARVDITRNVHSIAHSYTLMSGWREGEENSHKIYGAVRTLPLYHSLALIEREASLVMMMKMMGSSLATAVTQFLRKYWFFLKSVNSYFLKICFQVCDTAMAGFMCWLSLQKAFLVKIVLHLSGWKRTWKRVSGNPWALNLLYPS